MKGVAEKNNLSDVSRPLTTVRSEKSETLCMLIGQSGAHELSPQNHLEMTRTGFRKLYFLQRTSHDFENNIKILLMETNQPLLSWKMMHYAQK